MNRFLSATVLSFSIFSFQACSFYDTLPFPGFDSFASREAAVGALGGAALGAGVGGAIASQVGNHPVNIGVNAGIGAASGFVAGAVVAEYSKREQAKLASKEQVLLENQKKIDEMRSKMTDKPDFNKVDYKAYEEMYWDYSTNTPYQGPTSSY